MAAWLWLVCVLQGEEGSTGHASGELLIDRLAARAALNVCSIQRPGNRRTIVQQFRAPPVTGPLAVGFRIQARYFDIFQAHAANTSQQLVKPVDDKGYAVNCWLKGCASVP